MGNQMGLAALLNAMNDESARDALSTCCAADAWVEGMVARRPFADDDAVHAAATEVSAALAEADWLEAFAGHPLIGDVASLREKYRSTTAIAAGEQAGVAIAAEATLQELAALNQVYRDRFGFIFIVFATGKSADEMLTLLKARINNSRDDELQNAAVEQLKITQLRLDKLAERPGDA
jgi:OHCU decarboxylase